MAGADDLRTVRVEGKVHRVIDAKYPLVGVYDTQSTPSDLEATLEVAALTNLRVRSELAALKNLPKEERVTGPGSTPLMSAICNPNMEGSRFADDSYGVYYAAASLRTAIIETAYHRERFLRTAKRPPGPHSHAMRNYECGVVQPLHKLTRQSHSRWLSPDTANYPLSQAFARTWRDRGSYGFHYPSVRDPEGRCVAIFRPTAVKLPIRAAARYAYGWDGQRLAVVSELGESFHITGN